MNKYSDSSNRLKVLNKEDLLGQLRFPNLKFPAPRQNHQLSHTDSPVLTKSTSDTSLGISHFSIQQNKELERFFNSSLSPNALKLPALKLNPIQKSDFKSILDQINTIVQKKNKNDPQELLDGGVDNRVISKDNPFFYSVCGKGKKGPLTVKLKALTDDVISYVSTQEAFPGPKNYEKVFYRESFEIREFNPENCQVYIGIYSESKCEFKISVKFDKKKAKKKLADLKSDQDCSDSDWVSYKNSQNSPKLKTSEKNFIKANLKRQTIAFKAKDVEEEKTKWLNKRKEILNRRKTYVEAKKLKTVELLNKQSRRQEFERMIKKEQEKQESLEEFQKSLIVLSFIVKLAGEMQQVVHKQRLRKLDSIKVNLKVKNLQRFIREKLLKPGSLPCLSIASKSLLLYRSTLKGVFTSESAQKVVKVISEMTEGSLLSYKILNFRNKIVKIQKNYRRRHFIKQLQLKRLSYLWKSCIDKLLSKKVKKGKKLKSQENLKMKYKGIPKSAQNRILLEYYSGCWKQFRLEIREYMQNTQKDSVAPRLRYMPSQDEMNELIESLLRKY